ncbi:hypothetical protein [Burkholderia pyrrocinia]|uniref:hypothetical protein n=1 Tax=Burkholderia pyrrocinia TaxID=60550 RepID=UPI00191BD42A|nr:hypothetical protein [Burkholderia pyrrocinia]
MAMAAPTLAAPVFPPFICTISVISSPNLLIDVLLDLPIASTRLYRQSLDGIQPQTHQEMKCSTGRQLEIECQENGEEMNGADAPPQAKRKPAGRLHGARFDQT